MQGVELQLSFAVDNIKASLAVKRRLACEHVQVWKEVRILKPDFIFLYIGLNSFNACVFWDVHRLSFLCAIVGFHGHLSSYSLCFMEVNTRE